VKRKCSAFLLLIYIIVIAGCGQQNNQKYSGTNLNSIHASDSGFRKALSPIELEMLASGMVDIKTIDSSIAVDMKYASTDNFLKINFYKDLNKAYLQKEVALKLARAQAFLKEKFPAYSLLIYDAARPVRFQQQIWDSVKLPINEKTKYVSNPKNGSLHNFGAAVDLSIIDGNKKELDMGCTFDTLSPIAYPMLEWKFLAEGVLTKQQINNRSLLREVMRQAGFFNIQTEWWHFNSCTRAEAIRKYKRIE
jgi:D-alanyl-D-alanine dipeptidase